MSGENLNLGVASKDYAVKFRHVVFALLILLLALAVVTYNPADTAVLEGGSDGAISNAIGLFGAEAGRFLFYWFGITSYPLLLVLLAGAVRSVFPRKYPRRGYWLGVLLFALSFSILFGLNPGFFVEQTAKLGIGRVELPESALSGGVIGQWFAGPGSEYAREGWVRAGIGMIGTLIIGWCIGLGGLILMIFADWRDVGEYILDRSGREDDPSAEIEVHEEVVPEVEAVSEDEYRLDGGILIDDLNEELGLKLETENYDTLSGYLIEKLGHIPAKDDRDIVEEENLVFAVEEVKDNRISRVRLRILPEQEADEDDEEREGRKKQRRASEEEEEKE